ncbi:GtrA family protein [Mesorhizobium sp. BR1-1-9]|nr:MULTISPECIES: GtrA family protein [unclassified Mesorhizobium]MBZ9871584.1 GtrA family protein [Mesorhizobium sp. BR1-1-9]MBZ9940179.1 GtrA family protein [Mesorhizobium sp. BR1-1-13]TPM30377.1 GtrA family protein [Mesorhizobium sp. B2-2-2]
MMSVKATSRPRWRNDLAFALIAVLVLVAINACTGFRELTDAGGDNDSLLRLVEVRDLLAGQSWFDLHQYRMGLEGGFVMHWSRLVDAPIAAIVLAVSSLTGNTTFAENVAQVAWPALLFGLTMVFIIRAARRFAGDGAVLPSVIVGAAALYFIGIFEPGALDHHNVQLMLTVASLGFLLEASVCRPAAFLAGLCTALTLAVGMETAPYVAALGVCVAAMFAVDAAGERTIARDFGLGFAGVAALVFVATIPASGWSQTQCDAFSAMQFVVAALAGTGLAAIASIEAAVRTPGRRLLSLGALAFVLGAALLLLFPQCLASPYAGLDPRLKTLWLDHIDEAQSLFSIAVRDPAELAARYATPLVAIVLMALRLGKGSWGRQDSLVGVLLVVAFLVSVWQVRGSTFSIAFAVIPLSGWIAKWRQRAETSPSRGPVLRMAAAWLISVNSIWSGAAQAASAALATGAKITSDDAGADRSCQAKASFAALARMPDTTVLAVSNLGSPILAFTGHRALAGPYHRNVAGNLLVFDALLGSATDAKAVVASHRVGIVALCRGNPETRLLETKAPDGFLAGLMHGSVPDWLEPVAETQGAPLELYRVRLAG